MQSQGQDWFVQILLFCFLLADLSVRQKFYSRHCSLVSAWIIFTVFGCPEKVTKKFNLNLLKKLSCELLFKQCFVF